MLPDLIEIEPLEQPVRSEVTVPGSKSITNRALILAALADGEVTLRGALWSEDTQIMVECLQDLGFMVNVAADPIEECNRTITVYGQGGEVPPGGSDQRPLELFVGNAGTVARFLAAFVCLGKGVYRLHGTPRMHERPQAGLFNALRELGYHVEAEDRNDKLPVKIFGGGSQREWAQTTFPETSQSLLTSAAASQKKCTVSIEESSQFASALLLCAKAGGWNVTVVGENAEESSYVRMTSAMCQLVSSRRSPYCVPPDASSGSYIWAAGWLVSNPPSGLESPVRVKAWPDSNQNLQVDTLFTNHWPLQGTVSRKRHLGDSIMTAIVIAPFAERPVCFTDLGRLRLQECERVVALRTELAKCGANVVEEEDTLTVYPSELHGAEIETYNDHRVAMCFAILGLKVRGITIKNPACVKKTFPNFFQKLAAPPPKGLGATIRDANTGRRLGHEDLFAG